MMNEGLSKGNWVQRLNKGLNPSFEQRILHSLKCFISTRFEQRISPLFESKVVVPLFQTRVNQGLQILGLQPVLNLCLSCLSRPRSLVGVQAILSQ